MKKFVLAMLSAVLALNGRGQAQCVPTVDFTSYLTTVAGVPTTPSAQLVANTKYFLYVRVSDQAGATKSTAAFVIRRADGFTVDGSEIPATAAKGADGLTRFAITTDAASTEATLYVSIFSQCGSGPEARRSRPKQFLFPPRK